MTRSTGVTPFVQSARNERMVGLLRWINDHDEGDGVTIGVRQLAAETGLSVQAVVNHLKWLKAFGAVRSYVEQAVGQGRRPNRYVPVFTAEEWLEVGPRIAADLRSRMGGRPPPPRPRPLMVVVPEVAAAEAELDEGPVLPPLEPLEQAPLGDDELEAWSLLR